MRRQLEVTAEKEIQCCVLCRRFKYVVLIESYLDHAGIENDSEEVEDAVDSA